MSAKFGQITLKTRVMTAGDPLESQDGNTLLQVNDDGTATITSGGEAASTFAELASAAGVQTVTDSTTLGDIQSGLGLSDSNTVQDAIEASAGTSKQVATLDDIPAVPDVPVKAVKQNGSSLTPDSNGAVNVKGVYYATCSTAQNIADKVATLANSSETFVLETGVVVYVKFTYNSWTYMTLNVAGTGAKSVYVGARQNTSGNTWTSGEVVGFLYDGTYWRMLKHGYATNAGDTSGLVSIASSLSSTGEGVIQASHVVKNVGLSIAPLWVNNATTAYSAGDYVMYTDGKLYKAKVAIPANTAWNSSNWQAATIVDETASSSHVHSDYVSKTATTTQTLAGGLNFPPDVEVLVGDPEWTDAAVSIYAESGDGGNGYVFIGNGTRSIEISQTEIVQSVGSTTNRLQFPTWSGNSSKVIATDDQLRYSFVTPAVTTSTTDSADDTVSVTLTDRAVNSVTLSAGTTYANLTLPAKITGYARDFFIRLVITADVMPAISFKEPDGSAVSFDVDDDSWADIEKGVNIIMLTETAQ